MLTLFLKKLYNYTLIGPHLLVEPGIYIREENLGIRLEDNILVGEDKNYNLMQNIPILPEEIEDIMNN